ncbi:hypothetical protein MMC08_008641, partial [Hypocenomyce scalaris]|nr:hypothetical protein [Hypocenomyce scalaris]
PGIDAAAAPKEAPVIPARGCGMGLHSAAPRQSLIELAQERKSHPRKTSPSRLTMVDSLFHLVSAAAQAEAVTSAIVTTQQARKTPQSTASPLILSNCTDAHQARCVPSPSDTVIELAQLNTAYSQSIQFRLISTTHALNDACATGSDDAGMKSALRECTYSRLNICFQTNLSSLSQRAGRRPARLLHPPNERDVRQASRRVPGLGLLH